MVRSGIAVVPLLGEGAWNAARADLAASDVIIDALLGTGARGAPSPEAARAISLMNESPAPIVAVDVPSGVDALTGAVPGECVIAHATVTLALAKTGLMTYPGASYAGRVVLDGIGMPPALIESSRIKAHLTTPDDVREALPVRRPDAHKGDLGRVLIVAGSPGMSGAPSLAAMAALRSGAGLVHLSVPAVIAGEVSARHAEVMTHSAPEGDLSGLLEMTSTCQAVVVGPGMSCCERTSAIVDAMIAELSAPMVLDADAVNVLAGRAQVLREARAPVVLTPHPGELGRLLGVGADEINRDRLGWARRAALETGATVVLKGARTVIADKTGEAYVNPTGNSGMATAGMGDVLAGVAGSLCAAGLSGLAAGYCSAYIHGLAGDFAARDSGLDGMVAGDVLAHIPESFEAARTKTAMLWAMMPIAYAHMPEGW
jgi:NAD(P)H-hydrate epimerase